MTIAAAIALTGMAHMVGDYLIQSHWMANAKTKHWRPALVHGATYTLPFILITQSPLALLVIGGTHALIDRYRLARYVVWFRNLLAPKAWRASIKDATGSPADVPMWLSGWLLFIADNIVHMLINIASVVWL